MRAALLPASLAASLLAGRSRAACPGQSMLDNPEDPSAFGPWPVSSRVVVSRDAVKYPDDKGNGSITKRDIRGLEVWFPATPGSEKGAQPYKYSQSRQNNPHSEAIKLPECTSEPTAPKCCEWNQPYDHIWEGLPLDTAHGPYPVIIFIHGHAGWRSYMLHLVELWASRGFVVVAADYPGVCSFDMISQTIGVTPPRADEPGDTQLLLDELAALAHPNLAFLKGHIDLASIGVTGHSQGGLGTGTLSKTLSSAKVMIPMAGGGTHPRPDQYSSLIVGGAKDPASVLSGYAQAPAPKRHLTVASSGHETYTDLCWMAVAQDGITGVGRACDPPIAGSSTFEALADQGCRFAATAEAASMIPPEDAWPLVRYATAGAFEEVLLCDARMTAALAALPTRFNGTVLGGWKEDVSPGPAPSPPAPAPPVPAACVAELQKDCAGLQGNSIACASCVVKNEAGLKAAGCAIRLGTHDDSWAWCHQTLA